MTSPEGGFYSAEDADSEGQEGKFYTWTKDEIVKVLGKAKAGRFIEFYNVKPRGNFHDQTTKRKNGANILHRSQSLKKMTDDIENSRRLLFAHREKRVHPLKDDKVLVDWNGLMIGALAFSAGAFDEPIYLDAAEKAAGFILKNMQGPDGRLVHRYREGHAGLDATLDDYAFFLWGLIELYESSFKVEYLERALALTQIMIDDFWDKAGGGFYFTGKDAETLLARPKEIFDGAVPSGNSVAAHSLLRLARVTGNTDYEIRAANIFKAFSKNIQPMPSSHTHLMMAVDFSVGPATEVVVVGDSKAKSTQRMLKTLQAEYLPNTVVVFKPTEIELPGIVNFAKYTEKQKSVNGETTAFVCRNHLCNPPTTDIKSMEKLLEAKFSGDDQ